MAPVCGLENFNSQSDRLFGQTSDRGRAAPVRLASSAIPRSTFWEAKDSYLLCAELAGMNKEDLNLEDRNLDHQW